MTTLHEVGFALRRLIKRPGYSLSVLLTLGIGIALSAGMFTVLNGVLLQGLPYPGGDRVVSITSFNHEQGVPSDGNLTPAEVDALEDVEAFEHVAWFTWGGTNVVSGGRPREITINRVSPGFFPALGVAPRLGRWIEASDVAEGRDSVVLSHAEWERLTGRDPDIVGKPLQLIDDSATVVGVMPPEFAYPASDIGLWRAGDPSQLAANPGVFLNARYVNAIGRLGDGVSPEKARAELEAMSLGLHAEHGIQSAWRLRTTSLLDDAVGNVRPVLYGIFAVALVVLMIACANAGGLLAARLSARRGELAVMQALGATPGRVWRGLVVELLLLGIAATLLAIGLVYAGMEAFTALASGTLPRAGAVAVDGSALAFAAAVALLCPLLISLPFALRLYSRFSVNLHGAGKGVADGGRGVVALPVVALALAGAALVTGGAMVYSLKSMQSVDPGYRSEGIHAIQMFKGGGPDVWRSFGAAVANEMRAQHDVEDVAITTAAPLALIGSFTIDLQVPGRELPEPLEIGLRRVTPNYRDMLGIPLLAGRDFSEADDAAAPKVAIINRTLAQRVFGEIDPVGRDIALPLGDGDRVLFRVVGIAADIRNAGLRGATDPEVLIPFAQTPWVGMTFLVLAPNAGDDLVERLQEAIWTHDPQEATTRIYRLEDDVAAESAQLGFFSRMLGGFAVLAALLAAFGTYSVIALIQRQRTTEIGVRLALGADPPRIARQVLGFGCVLALIAGVIGSFVAFAVLRLLGSQLYGVSPAEPGLYAFGLLAVLLTALAASALPAWRAARTTPLDALHYE